MKFARMCLAAVAGIVLLSCSESMHPTGPEESGPSIRTDAISSEGPAGPTVTTDKPDYSPGDTVVITGAGWLPNESVSLVLTEEPAAHEATQWDVTADGEGTFVDRTFAIQIDHIGVAFQLTATGAASADTAQGTFTDGNFRVDTNVGAAVGSVSFPWVAFTGVSCTGTTLASGTGSYTSGGAVTLYDVTSAQSIEVQPTIPSGTAFISWRNGARTISTLNTCFPGGSNQSWTLNLLINTTTSINDAPDSPQPEGTSVTFTAHVTQNTNGGNVGSGKVKFLYGGTGCTTGTAIGDVNGLNLNNSTGLASVSTASLPAGTHTIRACYQGSESTNHASSNASMSFAVQAAASNVAPALAAIGNKSVAEGVELTFTASATDDGLPAPPSLTYSIANPASGTFPTGATINGATGAFSWTPSESDGPGTYRLKVVVSDGALQDDEEIEVTVTEANVAPALGSIGSKNVNEMAALSFTATATDADLPAQSLTFSLGTPAGACGYPTATGAAITSGGAFTWTPTEAQGPGTYCARVQVSDAIDTDFEDIQIEVAEVNAAPVLGSIGNRAVDELAELSFSATSTDSDTPAQIPAYSLGTPAGSCGYPVATGATITSGGAFTWTPTEAQGPGTYCARVQVSDGIDTDFEDIQIEVAEVNIAPVLGAIGNKNVDELVELSFTAAATDADLPAQPLTFSLGTPVESCGYPTATGAAITSSGAFTWTPTEAQGPGTFCARIQVSDGTDTDFEDIQIAVAEVNVAPVLTVPSSFSTEWGVPLSGKQASATDSDLPANTLTFSLVAPPTGMTINPSTGAISWTPTSLQTGAHVITVRVSDDGAGLLSDSDPTFTITVTARPTLVTYLRNSGGQYSDQDSLVARLTDAGDGTLNGASISGKTIAFTFDGTSAGSASTNSDGIAGVLYTIPKPDGNYTVVAGFAGDTQYGAASDDDNSFDVDAENATVTPGAGNSYAFPVGSPGSGSGTVSLTYVVQEDTDPSPEPNLNNGALAGDITRIGLKVSLVAVANGSKEDLTCDSVTASGGTGYARTVTFVCTHPSVALGAYEVAAVVANGGSPAASYYVGSYDDALTVYDASLGFVTGGGKFMIGTDRVSFGFVANVTGKGKAAPRGNLVVVRHHADGSSCRTKSNAIDAPAISGATATFSGKANYSCVDQYGAPLPGGAGNLALTAYVEDNGEPGSSSATTPDKFWVRVMGELLMETPARDHAKPLTGGNIQVPHPNRR